MGFSARLRKIPWSEGTATRGTSRRGCAHSGSLTTGGVECKKTGSQGLFTCIERVSPRNKRGTQRKVGPTMFGTGAEWRRNADSMLFLEGELALAVEGGDSIRGVFVVEGGYQDGVRVGDSYLAIPRDSFAEESGSRARGATYK